MGHFFLAYCGELDALLPYQRRLSQGRLQTGKDIQTAQGEINIRPARRGAELVEEEDGRIRNPGEEGPCKGFGDVARADLYRRISKPPFPSLRRPSPPATRWGVGGDVSIAARLYSPRFGNRDGLFAKGATRQMAAMSSGCILGVRRKSDNL